ncbi:Myb/SANT-like domain containing protein [Senna tora]|uniref:Myb/SANT-like domain containing protein n=1 Tax=Senna tora TaxID=362788 RepID=A0A834T9G8_9FABA|nr:Myb/SANT-like domain containing protein [Senna tora]
MSNSVGSAVARTHGTDRFYNPPAVRRNQQLAQQRQRQQQQLQRPLKSDTRVDPVETETRTDSDESTLSRPNSVGSSSPPRTANLTNLDRLISSVTPFVPAQFLSEVILFLISPLALAQEIKAWEEILDFSDVGVWITQTRLRGWRTAAADGNPYFCLGDLWESFREWSAYGVEVPLLLNESDSVKQYYVPYLSGIQLYVEPPSQRKPGEDGDAESTKETSSAGSTDSETEKRARGGVDGALKQGHLINVNSERLSGLTLRDTPPLTSSSDETEVVSLASQFPDLTKYRSCDLLPSSWLSVAWYPIYRIPVGSSLKSLDAAFLTFHTLSTHPRSQSEPKFHVSRGRKVHGVDESSLISLPSFALASYKLKGSIFSPKGDSEWEQANSLVRAADNWLQRLKVRHPDYQFFVSHSSRWR